MTQSKFSDGYYPLSKLTKEIENKKQIYFLPKQQRSNSLATSWSGKIEGQTTQTYPADCRKIAAVDSNKHDWD